jgi:RNA polymerase sigma-70 factor, ECF subfamily
VNNSIPKNQAKSAPEDLDLLGKIVSRDEESLLTLYRKYQRPVYSLALRILRTEEDAQKLLEEIFLHVWEKAKMFHPQRGSLETWLLTLTQHRAIDVLRTRRDKQRASKEKLDPVVLAGRSAESMALGQSVSQQATSTVSDNVADALSDLSPDEKQALELAYYEGYSQSEIAEMIAVPSEVVRKRIRQAMIKMHAHQKQAVNGAG